MTCSSCGEKPKKHCSSFTKSVIEIHNPETLVLLRKVVVPVSMGTEEQVPAAIGKYHNVILYYEANKHVYLYSSDGIPTYIEAEIPEDLLDRIDDLEDGLEALQQEVEEIKDNPDVVDIVPTYAALQAYDTSKLGDNDIVRVLQDEQHDGQSTYYRWNKQSSTWTYIGAVGDYYTKGQVDSLLDDKQDVLTAGSNITINANNEISATDTTYSNFVGTDGTAAGTAGLVPAPAATDAGKFLKADGSWDTAGGSSVNVVQTIGTSTTDVMSQKATTTMIHPADDTNHTRVAIGQSSYAPGAYTVSIGYRAQSGTGGRNIIIGPEATNASSTSYNISIGSEASCGANNAIAIGTHARASYSNSVAIGNWAETTHSGEVNIGSGTQPIGYNSSNYRLLTGLYDPQSAHDAATKGYVDTANSYSASEINTGGTWIDGSTIYKKTINFGALPNNTNKSVSNGFADGVINKVVKIEGYAYYPSAGLFMDLGGKDVYLWATGTDVEVRTYDDLSYWTECYITIYYTKN